MIDLTTPGVDIRPIQQLDGNADFAEVFFEGVHVPVENRIGHENDGWRVAMSTLRIERGMGTTNAAEIDVLVDEVESIFDQVDAWTNQRLVTDLVELRARVQRYRLNAYAMLSSSREESTNTLGMLHKVEWSTLQLALYELGLRALGAEKFRDTRELSDDEDSFRSRYWLARASLIYSGTNEIQRNLIAERCLGLAKDVVR
jgi:alkylation response protein AidB-like acyl-CoA dehydrogenase